jgi:UDP-glucose 4-epimerase
MSILVTGGAGYIGSHMARMLVRTGYRTLVVDDLSTGHREAVPEGVSFVVADIADRPRLVELMRQHGIETIFHFASRIQVGESVVDPRLYFRYNLGATIDLLESALEAGVRQFVLSSTAAVYGEPLRTPMREDHPTVPLNPYGETKLAIEKMLAAYERAYGLRYAALRYFNAAGADPECHGERHEPETHLIPLVLRAAAGLGGPVTIYGTDYETPDGTCIRDFVHVRDLCEAHLAAVTYLEGGGASGAFNLGTGVGHSVKEVILAAERVTGLRVPIVYGARRAGDPAWLVASADRAKEVLRWRPQRVSIDDIVGDAWRTIVAGGPTRQRAHPEPARAASTVRE